MKQPDGTCWRQMSRYHHLSDTEILDSIQTKPLLVRACRFDAKTRFVVIEIPQASQYRSKSGVSNLIRSLKSTSANARHYRIIDDWYLYVFFDECLDTDEVAQLLEKWVVAAGFTLGDDGIIVHSSADPMPLPLQLGFVWFNDSLQPLVRRDEISLENALALFLSDLKKYAVSASEFLGSLRRQLKQGPSTQQSQGEADPDPIIADQENSCPDTLSVESSTAPLARLVLGHNVHQGKTIRQECQGAKSASTRLALPHPKTALVPGCTATQDDSRGPPSPFT